MLELAIQYELEGLAKLACGKMVDEVSVSNVKTFIQVLKLHSTSSAAAENAYEELLRLIKEAPTYDLLRAMT